MFAQLYLARLRQVPLWMMKVKWWDNIAKSLVNAETAQMQVWVDFFAKLGIMASYGMHVWLVWDG